MDPRQRWNGIPQSEPQPVRHGRRDSQRARRPSGWPLAPRAIALGVATVLGLLGLLGGGACVGEGKLLQPPNGTSDGGSAAGGSHAGAGGGAGGGGVGGTGAGGQEPAPEICNFLDDDGDGQIDEGFDWQAGPWMNVFRLEPTSVDPDPHEVDRNITSPTAIRLSDGRIALAAIEGGGYGNDGFPDTGFVLVFSGAGELLLGPTSIVIETSGGNSVGIAEGPGGEIAALYGTTDYAGCTVACPIYLARHDPLTLNLLGVPADGFAPLDLPFSPLTGNDVAWTGAAYAIASRDTSSGLHVSWLNAAADAVAQDSTPSVAPAAQARLAAGPSGLGWASSTPVISEDQPWSAIHVGVRSASGSGTVLSDTEAVSNARTYLVASGGGRRIGWLGDSLIVTYVTDPWGSAHASVARFATSGDVLAGPVQLGGATAEIMDMIAQGGTVLALVNNGTMSATLHRLGEQLEAVDSPSGALTFSTNTGYLSMALADESLLVFRSATGVGDGSFSRNLDMMRVVCP